ncbi:MAG: DEAD/DEAH box helicase, partial [Actinobacteria bacterium]|nr:DEAD/DEAH box helicase [Actinomycetota bacterium]
MSTSLEPTEALSPAERLEAALADPAAWWPHVVLREHQIEALDELGVRLRAGATRTWVDAPTGSGKTITFCALAAALDGSAVVFVPRRNLAGQTTQALSTFFPDVSFTIDGVGSIGRPGVAICTYQAGLRNQDGADWDAVTLVICDEAHTTLGAQTRRMVDRAKNAVIVGFTATPATTRGHVEQVFGPVAATLDRQSAIDRGILCPLRSLRVERAVDLSDVTRVRGDFDQASLGRALDRALWHRACADVWAEHFMPLGLAGVAYTATVAQAHALADEMTARGVRAAAVSGQTQARALQRALREFGAGKIDVLCNADLLTEGWDETRASVVMHLAPTTSERVFVQRLGRVMRPAEGKEAVSVEFLPVGDPMGVQTSHDLFGMGWYKPLGRVAGPPEGSERGKLARAAELLAQQDGGRASLVNPGASPSTVVAGFQDGGWREADPAQIPIGVMEEWVEAAARDTNWQEVAEKLAAGIDPLGAYAWWALSGVVARKAEDGDGQALWRAWALALLVRPDLRQALPADAPRAVLDRLHMTARERVRALWFHADQAGKWENVASLEQQGRSAERRRRWSALDSASSWAPAWAWEVSRGLADASRPGRSQEIHRIAKWESQHLIENGGEIGLIGLWLRAVGAPAPDPVAPPADGSSLKVGQAGRVVLALGPGDVPLRSEDIRVASRAAGTCGCWAALRGALDAIDWTEPEARRALRAAVGNRNSRALHSVRAWNQLRLKAPRLPEAAEVGIGVQGSEDGGTTRRRRRRRRKMSTSEVVGAAAIAASGDGATDDGAGATAVAAASAPADANGG